MTVKAQRRSGFGQVVIEFRLPLLADLVSDMARLAAHVERRMAAAFVRNIQAFGVTFEAEVLCFVARLGLQQLKLIVGLVRICDT